MNLWFLLVMMTNFMWIYFSTALFIDRCAHIWVTLIKTLNHTITPHRSQTLTRPRNQAASLFSQLDEYCSRDRPKAVFPETPLSFARPLHARLLFVFRIIWLCESISSERKLSKRLLRVAFLSHVTLGDSESASKNMSEPNFLNWQYSKLKILGKWIYVVFVRMLILYQAYKIKFDIYIGLYGYASPSSRVWSE